ncbi:tRNA pseudouridine synthase B [Backusella circina FSU 941]|nr:tRNA pseudouridine synthase B [Backusella circina FSU 941]
MPVIRQRDRLKIGHGGTLDPMARGVLVLGVGTGCKQLHQYLDGTKEYTVTAKFGEATDTYDAEGTITHTGPIDHLTRQLLEEALVHFRGEITQLPPIYSALKVNGKRMYEYARTGLVLPQPIQPRNVKITKLELGAFDGTTCILHVTCGGGTYMRSLVYDVAESLGTCAHMIELERTRQGLYTLDKTLALDESFCVKEVVECIHSS